MATGHETGDTEGLWLQPAREKLGVREGRTSRRTELAGRRSGMKVRFGTRGAGPDPER